MNTELTFWHTLTQLATSRRVAGGAFIAAVLVAVGGTYLGTSVFALPVPIAAGGPILILIVAAAWRFLATATVPKAWQAIVAVVFMGIMLVAVAGFVGILLIAMWRFVASEELAQGPGEPLGELTLEEITSFLNDRSPELARDYREGARRHAQIVVSNDMPITGDQVTTRHRSQPEYNVAFADASGSMVKITALPLSSDVQYVNGTSRRGHSIPGAAFEANVAAFALDKNNGQMPLASVEHNGARGWFVPPPLRQDGNLYCQVAYYPGTHLFEVNGDLIWVETTSIAGRIERLRFSLSGDYDELRFAHGYAVIPASPPQFARLPLARIRPATTLSRDIERCAQVMKSVDQRGVDWLSDALAIWETPKTHSIQFEVSDVINDALFVVEGVPRAAS